MLVVIEKIRRNGLYLAIVIALITLVVFRNVEYLVAFGLGYLTSNLCFYINYHFVNLEKGIRFSLSNVAFNYIVRMVIYTVVLFSVVKLFSEYAILFTFIGCLNIRLGIVIYGFREKGGREDESK